MLREVVKKKQRFYVGFCNMSTQEKVYYWAEAFPYDVWWRNKYNVPFLSTQHRQITFEAMKFAWLENKMIQEMSKPPKTEQNESNLYNEIAEMSYEEVQKLLNGN